MSRQTIRNQAIALVKGYQTNDPIKLCKYLDIPVLYAELGRNIMGYRTRIYGVSTITLNTSLSMTDQRITCGHELGHHICGHDENMDFLKRSSLFTKMVGDEYEANCFMVELMLASHDWMPAETQEGVLRSVSLPTWAVDYVDWPYVKKLLVNQTGSIV